MASATGNFSSSVVSPSLEEARRQLRGAIEEQERIEALLMAKIEQIIAQATASASSSQNRLSAEIEALEEEERRATCAFESATQAYTRARQAAQEQRRLILLAPATASSTSRFASSTSRNSQSLGSGHHSASRTMDPFRNTLLAHSVSGEGDPGLTHNILTWELKRDEIRFDAEEGVLGKGAFGTVCKGILRGKPVAVKNIPLVFRHTRDGHLDARTSEMLEDFRNECAVMSKLLHPNVLLLMGVCIDQEANELLMVTELMENGSVFDILYNKKKKLPFKQRMKMAKDCALGMNYLHLNKPNPILHLDLKTANLLVDGNYVTKVADFGLAKVHGLEDSKGAGGTPYYMAPEVLNSDPYDSKADIYAFAIILWELVTQKPPYSDQKMARGAAGLAQLYSHVFVDKKRLPIPADCPTKLAQLIARCWASEPADRPSFQEIIDSRVLDEVILDETFSEANALARTFWKQHFCVKGELLDAVEWKHFARSLAQFCEVEADAIEKDLYWRALHMVLIVEHNVVTMERFSAILEWFGPFVKGKKLLHNVHSAIKMKGFYGDITSDQMGILMAGKAIGSYAIRFSGQQPGYFTITTLASKDNIQNYRVSHAPGKPYWLAQDKTFPSLRKLVKHYKSELGLKHPLDNSKYSQLVLEFKEGERENLYSGFFSSNTQQPQPQPPPPQQQEKEAKKDKIRKEKKEKGKKKDLRGK